MCEHNLVIGEEYTLMGGRITCFCDTEHPFPPHGRDAVYEGDLEGGHGFFLLHPFYCICGARIGRITILCGDSAPIDVTQEFLSLPVRSNGHTG